MEKRIPGLMQLRSVFGFCFVDGTWHSWNLAAAAHVVALWCQPARTTPAPKLTAHTHTLGLTALTCRRVS